jgi:hypothetical protein
MRLHVPEAPSDVAGRLAQVAQAVVTAAGASASLELVSALPRTDPALAGYPALEFLHDGRVAVRYSALPEAFEGPPFVELLVRLLAQPGSAAPEAAGAGLGLDDRSSRALADLDQTATLLVLVAPACPRCPVAARTAMVLALASPAITTTIVDAQQFPDIAQRFSVRATPATILDSELTVIGPTTLQAMADHILARRTGGFEDRVFHSFVECGRIPDAAARLLRPGGPAMLVRAWRQSTTGSRVGLLLACDDALGRAPEALDDAVADLLSLLGSSDAAMAGDTADLLGRIGHPSAGPALRALAGHPNPDVAEIAAEATDQLRKPDRA